MKDLRAIIAETLIMDQKVHGVTQQTLGEDGNTVSQNVRVCYHPNSQQYFFYVISLPYLHFK